MPSKATAAPANKSAANTAKSSRGLSVSGAVPAQFSPFMQLHQALGNQAMQQLLETGAIQAKLRISQPGDADEVEADRVARSITSTVHRDEAQPRRFSGEAGLRAVQPRAAGPAIQRATVDSPSRSSSARDLPSRPAHFIVEDDTPRLERGQMRKSEFLKLLKSSTIATADAALSAQRKPVKSSDYVEQWLAPYADQHSQNLETALTKYAPETARAHSAREYISLINSRVGRGVIEWAKTGKVSGLPADLAGQFGGGGGGGATGGFFGALRSFASSGVGSKILGFLGGAKAPEAVAPKNLQRKARDGASAGTHDADTVRSQLGSGQALDSRVQSQMSSAFGHDFSKVRVHADSKSSLLSAQLNARAFTIGDDIAFASGEYRPGTLIGDALIAHELAHVVQQSGGKESTAKKTNDAGLNDDSSLEQDADRSAVGAVLSTWTTVKGGLGQLGANALPRLKSGLRLQRCSCHQGQTPVKTPKMPAAPAATPAKPTPPVDPENSVFFEDPALQVPEETSRTLDFRQRETQGGGLTTTAQQRHQVIVDQPKDYSKINGLLVVRFAHPASEFPEGKESSNLKQAKRAVLDALAHLFRDISTFNYSSAAEEVRISQERARLSEALKGFTDSNPLNIYLATETEEETRSGEFFPTTARVFVNLRDVGDPAKLKTAIRIPLHNILGGPNPAKGGSDDPAASRTDMEKTLLHESIHSLLIARSADADSQWSRVQGQLSITGPEKVQRAANDLVRSYILAQDEIFTYSSVELLLPPQPGDKTEAKGAYEEYVKIANSFFKRHGAALKPERRKLSVSEKVKGKAVPWEIVYSFPTQLNLKSEDLEALNFILKQWPLNQLTARR
jgi:Domain of unknown function (DUF4157)